jgi:(E)-4-hydroxy-3-methylbut-2-enyl-diphosphate synthase
MKEAVSGCNKNHHFKVVSFYFDLLCLKKKRVSNFIRFKTREVIIGDIGIGGNNPVRIQSMTNTDSLDTASTVKQIIRLVEAGCEIVRIAVPGMAEAQNLEAIKNNLRQKGIRVPIIADVHFNPKVALAAAAIADKVRINPGNYSDRNIGKTNFAATEYQDAITRMRDRLAPLIEVCKTHRTALRIGSNHGSLSERIVSKYGNTPAGMVEAALEFVRICREIDFHQIVLSMKASNVRMMVYSNRLLIKQMIDQKMDYPIHLGVTEAGDGVEGRIKSALGIGALLTDGIGDTIRVSLTEDPVNEIPVAKKILKCVDSLPQFLAYKEINDHLLRLPHEYDHSIASKKFPDVDEKPPLVIGGPGKYHQHKPDVIWATKPPLTSNLKVIRDSSELTENDFKNDRLLVFESTENNSLFSFKKFLQKRRFFYRDQPVVLRKIWEHQEFFIEAAIELGYHFIDNLAQGLWIDMEGEIDREQLVNLSFQILQAAGARVTSAEYIACPSCGRTQYDIEKSLKAIKARTSHLKSLKIAVMGCIVNGPGEMADADFGYVGMAEGKVALFKGKTCVKRHIPESIAVDELVLLIKENSAWFEPDN